MLVSKKQYTAEEFEAIAALSENVDRRLELVDGEIIEVVSNAYASKIAALILGALVFYLKGNPIGHVTGADGGYRVGNDDYIPDVGYISKARLPDYPHDVAYLPLAPDLAVEVVSPSDSLKKVMDKVANYLAAQVVVWVVYPADQEIKVYAPGKQVKTRGVDDVLEGGDVLPGFTLAVRDIFEG